MNRIVLIGNGFDLAHGLKTSYKDFINWYWDKRFYDIVIESSAVSSDLLCTIKILPASGYNGWHSFSYSRGFFRDPLKTEFNISGLEFIEELKKYPESFEIVYPPFFENICKSIETKGWVDIENEYYNLLKKYALTFSSSEKLNELNEQMQYLQKLLTDYLIFTSQKGIAPFDDLRKKLYAPIDPQDISIEGFAEFRKYIDYCVSKQSLDWKDKQSRYGLDDKSINEIEFYKEKYGTDIYFVKYPDLFMLPDRILFVNFNYTNTVDFYILNDVSYQIHIHGELAKPQNMIFGYGDEMDQDYLQLQNLNDNECLRNIKSIKYLETDNYRSTLSFLESAPFQVYIMGHSCGNSDRTLLNTIFEHKNCISIKPYYYIRKDGSDNYIELVQNISRNFTDMKLMRNRVVNKMYCESLV